MEKDSALYQLMCVRMNDIMNDITNSDREYQEIVRKSDEYSGRLERIGLPVDIRQLIDSYVSEQNALLSRYGMLAYQLGVSDCKTMFLVKCLPTEVIVLYVMNREVTSPKIPRTSSIPCSLSNPHIGTLTA